MYSQQLVRVFSGLGAQYIVGQHQIVGGRSHNEDRLTVLTDFNAEVGITDDIPRSYFGCHDGHGGEKCSTYLKDELHKVGVRWALSID